METSKVRFRDVVDPLNPKEIAQAKSMAKQRGAAASDAAPLSKGQKVTAVKSEKGLREGEVYTVLGEEEIISQIVGEDKKNKLIKLQDSSGNILVIEGPCEGLFYEVKDAEPEEEAKEDPEKEKEVLKVKIGDIRKNMDAARRMGYDTEPYQKEIDRLEAEESPDKDAWSKEAIQASIEARRRKRQGKSSSEGSPKRAWTGSQKYSKGELEKVVDAKTGIPASVAVKLWGLEPGAAILESMASAYNDAMGMASGIPKPKNPEKATLVKGVVDKIRGDEDMGYSDGDFHLIDKYEGPKMGIDSNTGKIYSEGGDLLAKLEDGREEEIINNVWKKLTEAHSRK